MTAPYRKAVPGGALASPLPRPPPSRPPPGFGGVSVIGAPGRIFTTPSTMTGSPKRNPERIST
jgi:hypothetical protein